MTDEQPLTLDDIKERMRSISPAAASNEVRPRELIPHDLEQRIQKLERRTARIERQLETNQQRMFLRDEGYRPDVGNPLDQAQAAAGVCGACGLEGQRLEAWRSFDSYRVFTVCPRCGTREEF